MFSAERRSRDDAVNRELGLKPSFLVSPGAMPGLMDRSKIIV